jgi:hypothetical protein
MSEEKEPCYFCRDFFEESVRFHKENIYFRCESPEDYLRLFRKGAGKAVVGEGTTSYLYSRTAARDIHRFNPGAKILIMLREPVDFMHSLHSQYVAETTENETDFKKALALEEDRKHGKKLPPRVRCPSYVLYKERARYKEHIQRYVELFPREQIRLIVYEQFKKDNISAVKEVFGFLGVDDSFAVPILTVNPNKTVRFPALHFLIHSPGLKNFFRARTNVRLYYELKKISDRLSYRREPRKTLESPFVQELRRELQDSVKDLSAYCLEQELVVTDLFKLWGYDTIA